MVQLEHANLMVKEIQPTLDFLLTALPQWSVRGQGQNVWNGTTRNWLHVGDDNNYITLNDGAVGEPRNLAGITPGLAHLGFVVENLDSVINRLQARGYPVDIYGKKHPFRKTAYFIDPAGFQFEFIEYLSKQPEERNMYGGETGELTVNPNKEATLFMQTTNAQQLVDDLYKAVDCKDLAYLDDVIAEKVRFRLGNNPLITSKTEVLEANRQFFGSITSMRHTIDRVWTQNDDIICNGVVDYVRLDGTDYSAHFSTILTVKDGKIEDYLIYVDISEL